MSDKYPQIVATQGEWYLGRGNRTTRRVRESRHARRLREIPYARDRSTDHSGQ